MSDKVENFGVFDGWHVKDVLDVGKMSSRTQLDESNAQTYKYHQADLDC